ncbi:unnamed protein product, partial [Effrenium voratum]
MDGWEHDAQHDEASKHLLEESEEVEEVGDAIAAVAVAEEAVAATSSHVKREGDVKVAEEDVAKLRRSVGFDDDLDAYAFDVARLVQRFKNKERLPSRIRVRIYFVKAICIFGKQVEGFFGKAFIDPYLAYKLGTNILVSMRNMAQFNTNVPSFYRVEERDIVMPQEGRLQVDLFDYQDAFGETINGEKLIGSTVVDLEDRWHSNAWKDAMDRRQQIPTENRALINPQLSGQNCGSIEMWVEMIDSVRASDIKASELRKPPAMEIEVRLVIRTCKNVKLMDGTKTDVKVTVDLECKEYEGVTMGFPKLQATDTHIGSTGNAIFNWRVVYPRIVMPTKSCTLDLKLYQANNLSADEFIGAVSIDLRRYVEKVARDMDMIYIEKADLQFSASAGGEEDGGGEGAETVEEENVGSVQFEMWFMTQSEANQKRAGKGREDPNDFPQLVTPAEGRGWGDVLAGFSISLPDFGLMKKIIPIVLFTLLCLVLLRFIGLHAECHMCVEMLMALEMVAKRSGWELVNKSGHILWVVRKEDVAESLLQLQPGQWLSHIPGMHEACSKASLANAFKATASFWPRTWVIQGPERPDLADMLSSGFVIVKPNRGLQGKGIHLACSSDELQRVLSDDVVVQQYISRPLLLDARKWDLRLYALVLPHEDGLRCWLAREGIARVCADIYEELSHTNAKRDTMHLTNYSLNKRSEKFVCNEDPGSGHRGGKRALSAVLLRLQKEKLIASAASVWEELGNLVQHTAGAMRDELQKLALDPSTWDGREEVVQAVHTKFSQSFHILGHDLR